MSTSELLYIRKQKKLIRCIFLVSVLFKGLKTACKASSPLSENKSQTCRPTYTSTCFVSSGDSSNHRTPPIAQWSATSIHCTVSPNSHCIFSVVIKGSTRCSLWGGVVETPDLSSCFGWLRCCPSFYFGTEKNEDDILLSGLLLLLILWCLRKIWWLNLHWSLCGKTIRHCFDSPWMTDGKSGVNWVVLCWTEGDVPHLYGQRQRYIFPVESIKSASRYGNYCLQMIILVPKYIYRFKVQKCANGPLFPKNQTSTLGINFIIFNSIVAYWWWHAVQKAITRRSNTTWTR